jgi:phospholipase C
MKRLAALAACAVLAACSSGGSPIDGNALPLSAARSAPPAPRFKHIILMIQENRSFDNFFATYPGADGTTQGLTHTGKWVALTKAPLTGVDIGHTWQQFVKSYDNGKMDGFDLNGFGGWGNSGKAGTYPYQYVDPSQIAPYWTMAQQYVLADHMFETQASGSFIGHQDLIAAGTAINSTESLVNYPTNAPWGCDAPKGTVTSLLNTKRELLLDQGPFPCLSYPTLATLFDAAHVTWKYYAPPLSTNVGYLWSAFDAIKAVRYGPDWKRNIVEPQTKVFTDIAKGRLPQFSWVLPDWLDSDHPGTPTDDGPSWVASVVNAVGRSKYWKSTAILVVWDDWGGFYDHVTPPQVDYQGLGFRVPFLAIAPYAKKGYVSHNVYAFGSIVRFIEDNWNLGTLHATDQYSPDFVNDFFNFKQKPRAFVPIQAPRGKRYFLTRPPSYHAVDNQ